MTRRSFTDQVFSRLPRTDFLRRVAEIYTLYYYGSFGWEMEANGELNFMRYFSSNVGAVVFDVGANIGKWSTQVLNINPNLHIHAFEPTPRTFVKLQNNLVGKPVALNQCAVGARQGEATLHLTDHSQTNTLGWHESGC
ncbi:MAG: FkbM family methyltransferase [Chloroflexi bacterium]|nr:FkbM family methyltransferase [Chloroflexota bacterium]